MFKIDVEPESPNEGACLRYMLKRNDPMRGGVASPNEGACRKHFEPESPNEGACLRYVLDRNRRMRGRVKDM